MKQKIPCDVPSCSGFGKAVYRKRGEKASFHLCDEHAETFGYCVGCGVFIFPMMGEQGLCSDCYSAWEELSDELPAQKPLFDIV